MTIDKIILTKEILGQKKIKYENFVKRLFLRYPNRSVGFPRDRVLFQFLGILSQCPYG